jgi:hypothetical protein
MLALGCSGSETSSNGCGNSAERCEINAIATVCGDRITLECFEGATPDAASQCELALVEDTDAIYCCTSAVETTVAEGHDDWGGGSGIAGFGGAGFGGAGT